MVSVDSVAPSWVRFAKDMPVPPVLDEDQMMVTIPMTSHAQALIRRRIKVAHKEMTIHPSASGLRRLAYSSKRPMAMIRGLPFLLAKCQQDNHATVARLVLPRNMRCLWDGGETSSFLSSCFPCRGPWA